MDYELITTRLRLQEVEEHFDIFSGQIIDNNHGIGDATNCFVKYKKRAVCAQCADNIPEGCYGVVYAARVGGEGVLAAYPYCFECSERAAIYSPLFRQFIIYLSSFKDHYKGEVCEPWHITKAEG